MTRWPWATPHRVARAVSLILLILAALWPGWAAAQFRIRLGAEFEGETSVAKPGVAPGVLPVPGADGQALRKKLRFLRTYAESNSGSTHTQAADLYQDVLASLENTPELQHDYFLPTEKEEKSEAAVTVNATVRSEIDAAFLRLPPEVWRVYQLRFGVSAQRLLEEALAEGNTAALEKICRLYFYTEAGYQAAYLLGEAYLDEGQPLSAARCFRRLKDSPGARRFDPALTIKLAASQYLADHAQQAVATLGALRKEFPAVMLSVAGRDIHGPAAGDQGLVWLAGLVGERRTDGAARGQWLVHRGNPARNAASGGGEPVVLRWQAFTSDNPQLVDEREGVIPYLMRRWEQRGQLALPSAQPLVIRRASGSGSGEREQALVVARSINGLVAIDLATGKRVLQAEEPEPSTVESASPLGPDVFGRLSTGSATDSLERRLWSDGAVGQLSSDGERIYQIKYPRPQIEDEDEESPRSRRRSATSQPRGRPGNILQALTLPQRRGEFSVAWEIDGASEPAQSPLAGVTFLGPPLPLRGVLYVLAEFTGTTTELTSGDTRLLAIDPRNLEGEPFDDGFDHISAAQILWSQRIAQFDDASGSAMYGDLRALGGFTGGRNLRRRVGLSPSTADGILVCPTGVGAVVAVDTSTRSLRWGFKYPLGAAASDERIERRRNGNGADAPYWIDAAVTIAEGRVLLTSPLSQQLHCLNLADGKELWSAPREDGLYVAGVQQGKVIVVGSRKLRAFQLTATDAGGKLAWSQGVDLPAADRPAGHGFLAGDSYYLPLTSGEIAVIDVEKGKLAKQLRSPEGRPLGNLIGYGDVVLSLGATSIDCFEQRQSLEGSLRERLAKNPTDPRALRESAKRALYDGKPEEAAALLRQSLQARPDPQTQQLLVACLTQLVRTDAVKHRALLDELGQLAQRRMDQIAYLRLLAAALQREAKPGEAMQALLHLANVMGDRDVPSGDTTLSSAAVIETALAELYRSCPADQRATLDSAIERALAPALAAADSHDLWQFLDRYGFHPLAAKARRELVSRALATDRQDPPRPSAAPVHGPVPTRTEALWLLAQLEQASDKATAGWAAAQKAKLLTQAGQVHDAAAAYRRLRGEFADPVCLADKTGKQLFDELAADSPVRRCLDSAGPTWPSGDVSTETVASTPAPRSLWPVALEGAAAWVEKTRLHFNTTTNKLLARDSVGRPLWELQLEAPMAGVAHSVSRAVALGQLLIIQTGDEVLALDVLRSERPTILWRRSLADGPLGRSGQQAAASAMNALTVSGVWASQFGIMAAVPQGRLGPVTHRSICLQQDETLTAVDPLTGRTLWSRRGTPAGGLLFGDDDVLAVIAAGSDKALVLRAADGEIVGQPALAPAASVVGTVGSRLIVWENRDGKQVLRVVEATGKELRRLGQFDAGSKATQVDSEAVAVLQPSGDLAVLRIADGREELRRKGLKLPNKLDRIHVTRSADGFFLAVSRPDDERERVAWTMLPRQDLLAGDEFNRPLVNGLLYAFSRSGEELWKDGPNRVEGCAWALDQPPDLPVLVFISDERARGGGQMRIKLVDKRTGRTIYDHRRPGQPDAIEVQGDPEEGLIVLKLPGPGGRVNLKFAEASGSPKATVPLEAPPKK